MDEYTLSAFGRYAGGCSRVAFAEVSSRSLARCFAAMATKVADWLPQAISNGTGALQGIELTLEWSGAAARVPAPDRPELPRGSIDGRPSPARRTLRRMTLRRLGCPAQTTEALRSRNAELLGARS